MNKLKLNAESFIQTHWDGISDMTCAVHEGSSLKELELIRQDTWVTDEAGAGPRDPELANSCIPMAEKALAKAIENKDFKPEIVRLTGFYFSGNKSPVLEEALKKREENGLPKIEIFVGHFGVVSGILCAEVGLKKLSAGRS